MNTSSSHNQQNDKARAAAADNRDRHGERSSHPLDKAQDHLADICVRLDTLRQRLGATLSNEDMAALGAVITELQSLAELPNAAVDPDLPSGTAPPPEPASANPATTRPHPQDQPDKRK